MNFFIMVSLFLSAALGVFRGIDLALLTDAETASASSARSGCGTVLAVAVGAAVAAGLLLSAAGRRCGAAARLPASWHWRRLSAMVRPLCCASSGWGAAR